LSIGVARRDEGRGRIVDLEEGEKEVDEGKRKRRSVYGVQGLTRRSGGTEIKRPCFHIKDLLTSVPPDLLL
jgi:hypothetical protein